MTAPSPALSRVRDDACPAEVVRVQRGRWKGMSGTVVAHSGDWRLVRFRFCNTHPVWFRGCLARQIDGGPVSVREFKAHRRWQQRTARLREREGQEAA